MKKILFLILFLSCVGISYSQEIPNLEVSTLLSCKNFTLSVGVTSRIMSFKDVDLRVGYVTGNKWVMGLSFDLDNLEKIADVEYIWEDTLLTSLLVWGGLDFGTGEYDYGVSIILVSANF